jgi:hypothetical protein
MNTNQNRLRIWTDKDGCSGCKHCGMDPDCDPYCAHPKVLAVHPIGVNISKAIRNFCGNAGGELMLWEKR